jgi:hypothetical protein
MLHGNISKSQCCGLIVPLPKKGDLTDAGNWRGITLLPHVTKLYNKLLMMRVVKAVDVHLQPTQNGFRPARGCVQHIAALGMIRDLAETREFPLHGCFVDFSKAFDSVRWEAIVDELRYWHAPDGIVRAIFNVDARMLGASSSRRR